MKKLCIKCCNLALEGSRYCKDHLPERAKKTYQEKEYKKMKNKIYGSKKWKTLREKVFYRDLYTCQLCGAKAEEIHHIVNLSKDESKAFDIENLMAICRDCHIHLHRRERQKNSQY